MDRIALLQNILDRINVPVERVSVQASHIKTSYLSAGSGKPLLLIHGGDAGAGGIRWFPIISSLVSSFHVIIPDVVGYGESDKPSVPYDRPYFSIWLHNFIDALGLKKVNVVGHSVGGAIALQFSLDHPEYVERLVLVNAAGLGKGTQRIPIEIKLRMIWQNLFPSREASRWFLEHYGLFSATTMTKTMMDVEEYGCEVVRKEGGRRVFWLGRGRVITPISTEQISQYSQPTLLIWGEEDLNFPPSIAQSSIQIMSNAQLTLIPRAGHNCFYDRPDLFTDILKRFLMEGESRS